MKLRDWLVWSGLALGVVGAGIAIESFLPQKLLHTEADVPRVLASARNPYGHATLPAIDIEFLRCGSTNIPEFIAVRGAFSFTPHVLTHSAVLIRHPRATFLYDTGLCTDIQLFLMDQSPYFNQTLGKFVMEQSLSEHLQRRKLKPADLDFALLSHLHWDHVSGVPDLPGVKLRVNSVEYVAGLDGLLDQHQSLVRRLLGNNPLDFFDCTGPAYEGFRSSLDLFGDGSIIMVPLPGHTHGQTGMIINRSNGSRLFLVADAAWFAENYLKPATMHPFIWSQVTSDNITARQTLLKLNHFARQHPDVPVIAMHDAHAQETFQYKHAPSVIQQY